MEVLIMAKKCSCCGKEHDEVKEFKLPVIGYGSFFDVVDEQIDTTRFSLCPDCAKKINKYIKKKLPAGVTLEDFWRCREVEKHAKNLDGVPITYHEYEYEDILINVFLKFMPKVIFGEHYRLERLRYRFWSLFYIVK